MGRADIVSVGDWIRALLLQLMSDADELREIHHTVGAEATSVRHHPSTVEHRTQLFDPTWLAAAYQVGFRATFLANNEEGDEGLVDIDDYPGSGLSFRRIVIEHGFDHATSTPLDRTDWSDDAASVDALADDILIADTDWSPYLPWYQTRVVAAYQLAATATRMDWSAWPPTPTERPLVDPALEAWPDPTVGDVIRYAIVHDLTELPGVRSVDTGPDPWDTDRVAITYAPTDSLHVSHLPWEVLRTLGRYGYRPIEGYYRRPWWGHRSRADPPVPRRIEFARGHALERWIDQRLAASPIREYFDTVLQILGAEYPALSWADYLPCVTAHIITNLELKRLAADADP